MDTTTQTRREVDQIADRPIDRPRAQTETHRRELTHTLFLRIEASADEHVRRSLRSSVVCVNMPMAATVARRFDRRGADRDDLEQVAYVGLANATRRFRLAERKDFLTFAVPTISGELSRYFRDHTWAVRPPRRIQQLQAQIRHTNETWAHRSGRTPSGSELSAALQIAEADITEAMLADGCWSPVSLDAPAWPDRPGGLIDQLPAADDPAGAVETHQDLIWAMSCLSREEREMIDLWIFHDWSQHRIGQRLGLSQLQVSRTIAMALSRVRERLGAAS